MDSAAVRFHIFGADDFVFLIVGPFHKNIRSQSLDQGQGSCFLEDGDKVKATIFFRGREMAHPEIGRRILERLVQELADVAIAETMPRPSPAVLLRIPEGSRSRAVKVTAPPSC